jgi:hypothetical protein
MYDGIAFGNHSATLCVLAGWPSIQLIDAAGQPLEIKPVRARIYPAATSIAAVTLLAHHGLSTTKPSWQGAVLRPGQATVTLNWLIGSDNCKYWPHPRPWFACRCRATAAH